MITFRASLLFAACTLGSIAFANFVQESVKFAPIYRFDGSSASFCYPDYPSSQNDGRCYGQLSDNTPSFVQKTYCHPWTVYTYWLWYGKQKQCIKFFDKGHGDDWEHVSVYTLNGKTTGVMYFQHKGWYSRSYPHFERSGQRPIVYIGKVSHGSYHVGCNGKCSIKNFFTKGCLGSAKYCQGGCGYWDDFRNPGPQLAKYKLYDLQKGKLIHGIKRPNRAICLNSCKGAKGRALTTAGCWQNKT